MIKRIILITETSFNSRDYERFGVDILRRNGFEVEVWDITPAVRPHVNCETGTFDCEGLSVFQDKNELCEKLSHLKNSDFAIDLGAYGIRTFCVYRALSASGANYAVHMSNALPDRGIRTSKASYCLKKIKGIYDSNVLPSSVGNKSRFSHYKENVYRLSQKILNILFPRLPFKWFGIKPASLILAGGEKSFVYPYPIDRTTETLWAHAMDYDLYLQEKKEDCKNRPIAVFLDLYFPFHKDRQYNRTSCFISPERYYSLLDKFFKHIEEELGLEVVIAAHPTSDYENHPDYFKRRKCIKGQTIKLVKESQLVLAHDSTALTFANLFSKPVIFLTSTEMDKSNPFIGEKASWFGKKAIYMDIDRDVDLKTELEVNHACYDDYKRSYIKTDNSKDQPFWQIVADKLKA